MPDLIQLAIPAFIALMLVEAIVGVLLQREIYEVKDAAASISMGLGNLATDLLAKVVQFSILTFLYRFAIFHIDYQWWAWVLLFFCDEFSYYWFHRVSHECRIFWASHVVHHSSQRYNLSTALRQTWTGSFMSFVFWIWLPIVGFPPIMIMTMKAISLLYQFWIHTELIHSLGPLEFVFNTPSHHRVHHGSNPRYIDRNHGGTLIIWDKLFGTFEPENPADPVCFGLTKNIQTYNPVRIAFHEWAALFHDAWAAPGWRNKLHYIFGNPGWRHEQFDSVVAQASPRAQRPFPETNSELFQKCHRDS
jgi:sterol desaturase/sphingolipid hydroxylase (fatty acid hydroxylase superfamily)